MRTNSPEFIEGLVGDLRPFRPLTLQRGLLTAAASVGLSVGVTVSFIGIRPQLIAENPDPVFLLAAGLFLMLGTASSYAVIAMSRPHVGNTHGGWIWAVVMAALLPITAGVLGLIKDENVFIQSAPAQGINCVAYGSFFALIIGGALTMWLRRGAPTSPQRAGLLTGIAAGSLGMFAYSLYCPYDNIYHIGMWHSMTVVVSAIAGRIVVPALIRW